ncbi:MAG: hypothetical protein IT530_08395 [Burkholderiales bacterium]|nr:hypothetical protein [Burkholderiales bacterium]
MGLSATGVGSIVATGGTVFFAAIVFAGFLAALRAAGLVPAAFFFGNPVGFTPRSRFATLARLATVCLLADAPFLAPVRLPAAARFFAAAMRSGRLPTAPLRAADFGLFAVGRDNARRAAFFAGLRAILRADRFTDFLAADLFLAAMFASGYEDTGLPTLM